VSTVFAPKVLCVKVHCYDAKCTCQTEDLAFFDKCFAVNISKLDSRMLDCFGGTNS